MTPEDGTIELPEDLRDVFARATDPRAALGALFGLAVGDALGTTLEFRVMQGPAFPALATGPLVDVVGGGPFALAAGEVTDDTQMATALADQLRVSTREVSTEDLVERYIAWSEVCFDIGMQTRRALSYAESGDGALVAGRRVWNEATRGKPAGNGSLMRTAPIGVFLAHAPAARRQLSLSDSAITHFDPRCQLACALFNAAIAHGMERGADGPGAYRAARDELAPVVEILLVRHPDIAEVIRSAAADLAADLEAAGRDDPGLYGDQLHIGDTAGFVRVAFRLAFWHLLHAPDFKSAVVDAANRGGDADTNAAITGALLGAVLRVDAIPSHWIAQLLAAPGLTAGGADYHPRVFLHAIHSMLGADREPARGRDLAPFVARAFPAEAAAADRSLLEGAVKGRVWPIGQGVELTGWRRGAPDAGVASGRLNSGEEVLVTVRLAEGGPGDDELARRLRLDLPGIAPLVAIGRFDEEGRALVALVERRPEGEPLSLPGFPVAAPLAMERFAELLAIAAAAADAGLVLEGIRPELIYAGGSALAGIAPRGATFLRAGPSPVASPWRGLYEAPEIARGLEPTPAADVFSACAVLAFMLTRRSPFEQAGQDQAAQAAAMIAGPPLLPLPLDDVLLAALGAGLDPDPARRPTARELLRAAAERP